MSQSQRSTRRLARRVGWETILALLVLIAVIGGTVLNKDFLTVENWSNLLANFVEIALIALPLSLIVITNEIDLSVASMLGLSSSLLGLLWQYKLPIPLGIVICLLAGALCGALNGFLIVRFRLPSLAVTIGTLALFRGFAYIVLGDKAVADYPPEYAEFGLGVVPYTFIPLPFVLFIILALIFWVLLHHTTVGRNIYAIGGNQMAARFSGVNISRLKMLLFIASGVISALAGIVFTFRFSSSRDDKGPGFELRAIAAVFLGGVTVQGGKGTVTGVVLSLLLIGIINNVLTLADVASEILRIVTGSLLIISILLPNLIASTHERWRLMQRQKEITRLGGASVAK
ncbi:MAG: ABC transporter permease [Verrucomicrobia bacterium]|nr:ABC transporter permease [Verrucomicrobiota bacterium]